MPASLYTQFRGSRWYRVAKTQVILGPFSGGLNSEEEPDLLGPNFLTDCINYVIRPGGVLYHRPPAQVSNASQFDPTTKNTYILGNALGKAFFASVDKTSLQASIYQDGGGSFTSRFASTTIPLSANSIPLGIYVYNNTYYITTSLDGVYQAANLTAALAATPTSNVGGTNEIMASHIVKDRLIQVSLNKVYWSKATDFSVWSTPDGGSLNTYAEDGAATLASIVWNDAIYLFKETSIWRFSWSTDPSIDGTFEKLTSEGGGYSVVLKNNELIYCNVNGVYSFVNGYIRELSSPIRTIYRHAARTGSLPIVGLLGDLVIVGPLNGAVAARTGETVTNTIGDHYFVYDVRLDIWYRWQFSAGYGTNSVSGPTDKVTLGIGTSSSEIQTFWWTGITSEGRVLVQMYLTSTLVSTYETSTGQIFDIARNNNNRIIGHRFASPVLTLGDFEKFKRLFGGTIDAVVGGSGAAGPPNSVINVNIVKDANATSTVTLTPQADKLKFGAGYRFRSMQLIHDTITGVDPTPGFAFGELQGISRAKLTVGVSRDTTVAAQ